MHNQAMTLLALATCAMTAACAPLPDNIPPTSVSEVPYQSWNCQQLGAEELRLTSALSSASARQARAHSNDALGVFFLKMPIGSMSGQNVAPQIARFKGEQEAVRRASMRNGCVDTTVTVRYVPGAATPDVPSSARPAVEP
jgi:hypothetical protein